jgi:hypothetical protein
MRSLDRRFRLLPATAGQERYQPRPQSFSTENAMSMRMDRIEVEPHDESRDPSVPRIVELSPHVIALGWPFERRRGETR